MKRSRIRPLRIAVPFVILSLAGCSIPFPKTAVSASSDPVATYSLPFTDIGSSYAQTQIVDLYNRNIVTGYSNHQFQPTRPVTRAEFVTMLDRAFQMKQISDSIQIFRDVPAGHWAYQWIQTGVNLGFASGESPTTFQPDTPIKREEVAAVVDRAFQSIKLQPTGQPTGFPDINSADSWAISYVNQIQAYQVMNGDESGFRPKDFITRQEMAVVLDKVVNMLPQPQTANAGSTPIQLGWQYPNTQPTSAFEAEVEASGSINTLSPRWIFIDKTANSFDIDDTTTDTDKRSLVDWAHAHGKQVWPLIGNRFIQDRTNQMLSDSTTRSTLEDQIVQFANNYHVDGFNIDFEDLKVPSSAQADVFLQFIQELKSKLNLSAPNVKLSIDVPPDSGTDWSAPYNYNALANAADYLVVMGYDEHWYGDPQMGSVSSMPWTKTNIQKLLTEVPANQLILGLPLYSRDWYVQNGVTQSGVDDFTISDEENVISQRHAAVTWNDTLGQYIAQYSNPLQHTIWVEDSHSLSVKYQYILYQKLAGAAYWYMGAGTQGIWDGIQNVTRLYSLQANK